MFTSILNGCHRLSSRITGSKKWETYHSQHQVKGGKGAGKREQKKWKGGERNGDERKL